MIGQEQRHLLMEIERCSNQPYEPNRNIRAEVFSLLQLIESERKEGHVEEEKLTYAEAVVLKMLAEERFHKKQGIELAYEWTLRARRLAPGYQAAAELECLLLLHMAGDELANQKPFPAILETDNAATRKKHVEDILQGVEARLEKAAKRQEILEKGLHAAREASHASYEQIYTELLFQSTQRETLLHETAERAKAFAESLLGSFYSSELLDELQKAVRAVAATETAMSAMVRKHIPVEETTPAESALEMLNELIGLTEIKDRVKQLAQFLQYQKIRSEKGWMMRDPQPLHVVLMGNPGTGKTTLARLLAKLYHELGLLERDEVIEVDRSHLVGAYIGQTEQRTMEAVQRAVGGVLFIDEAYSLNQGDGQGSDYGQVAIDTLVAAMTSGEYAGKFVVILAGYPEEMRNFLAANTGLRSRFPESGYYLLPDYSNEELLTIAKKVAERNDYTLLPATLQAIGQRIEQERVDETFGNARAVTNIVLDAIFTKGNRVNLDSELQLNDFMVIEPEDVTLKQKKASDEPLQDIEHLIGLTSLKAELKKIVSFLKIQRFRLQQGLHAVPVELHAVFTGNPGTGKTTVAKLYAKLLREAGYLKRGHLVTVSRADLVANYVGQTATQTKRKIREALGGVLFIDEAYALLSAGENDFGREAIHTLVDEMSKHEENLVVVLAGYPHEIEQLIQSNPGLSSRFKKYFYFPDYTDKELLQILRSSIDAAGYSLDEEAEGKIAQKLGWLYEQELLSGNARFVKTIVMEAIQEQAVRLGSLPQTALTTELLDLLTWDDFAPVFARLVTGTVFDASETGI